MVLMCQVCICNFQMIIRCLIYVASFEFILKSVHSSFTGAEHTQTLLQRNRGTADKVSLTFRSYQFLQMEPRGTKDNIVRKQNPCAKSVSCKHSLPPDRRAHTHTQYFVTLFLGSLLTRFRLAPHFNSIHSNPIFSDSPRIIF